MKQFVLIILGVWIGFQSQGQYLKEQPLVHTYSIVAYDSITGDMGVAVQSHWFSVGTIVTWAEAGVGAVATQSLVNPAFGPQGLSLLKSGLPAADVVSALVKTDAGQAFRQLGVVDALGRTASHTGDKCIQAAGGRVGKHYAVQANLMANDKVWPAMAKAFEQSTGTLAERMLVTLEAAEAVGGDIRGKQSAALLVVSGTSTGKPWIDRKVDIRIDDHPEPLKELRRVYKVHQAYEFMNRGDLATEEGDFELASKLYGEAEKMFPDNLEMQFWHAINLANTGDMKSALPMFKSIFAKDPNWKILTPRLTANGFLEVSDKDLETILKQ